MPRARRQTLISSATQAEPAPAAYHHGDLRRALIEAAVALLAEQNHWDFSLREVARRAGVSHNAPYNHFADKRALLVAMAAVGFHSLREQMQRKAAQAASADEALVAIGAAYVRFGVAHPAQYRLMFGLALDHAKKDPSSELEQAGLAARTVLAEVIQRGAREGAFAISAADQAALDLAVLTAWSLVHGLTMLTLDGLAGETSSKPREAARLTEQVALTLLNGLREVRPTL